MSTIQIEARELEAGDQLVRTTKTGTVITITLSYVGYYVGTNRVEWEGYGRNGTPRYGLYGHDEKVEVIR